MQDYRIIVEYQQQITEPKTSPKYVQQPPKTEVKRVSETKDIKAKNFLTPSRTVAVGLAVANKINGYVGEYTENVIAQRKTQIGLTAAGIGLLAMSNPVTAAIAAATYVANKGITYSINVYKANLTSSYMKTLSNGTVKTGR